MTQFNPSSIAGIAYTGIGLGLIAGISLKTLDIMQDAFREDRQQKQKQKQFKVPKFKPPKSMFIEPKLRIPKWEY